MEMYGGSAARRPTRKIASAPAPARQPQARLSHEMAGPRGGQIELVALFDLAAAIE